MKSKKRQFHCEKCGNPCEIYKKGRKHRVLVCPKCGVIATNPLPLAAIAAAAPFVIDAISSIIPKKSEQTTSAAPRGELPTHKARGGETKGERYVKLALGGKA